MYETVIVYEPNLDDGQLEAAIAKVEGTVKAHQGTILKKENWGKRKLAYEIKKHNYGHYHLLIHDGDQELVRDLERQFKIDESILRHLCVKKDKFAPDGEAKFVDDSVAAE